MDRGRDVAIVLSGGGMNGVLMELGFLRRVRESPLWPRVGWIFGTSAGALVGSMAALDRLDELEEFLLTLRADETFRPNRLWRLPLLGLYDYRLPQTVAARLGEPVEIGRALAEAPIELVVLATDLSDAHEGDDYELAYSSRQTPPELMAQAVFASAAISALVLPLKVGERIATDGSWVRNFPLGYAYDHPEVELIVSFRFLARYPKLNAAGLAAMRRRLERFRRVPPLRAFIAELQSAEERAERGEPAHLAEMIVRLARVAIMRNTQLEESRADERDLELHELASLRRDVVALARTRDDALADALDERFAAARFPFRADRIVPRITVRGSSEDISLDPGFRTSQPWGAEDKRRLILRGWALTDEELSRWSDDKL
ncbi:MAG: patatin-like phospholipase family protein [Gaiellaceae bacterium]